MADQLIRPPISLFDTNGTMTDHVARKRAETFLVHFFARPSSLAHGTALQLTKPHLGTRPEDSSVRSVECGLLQRLGTMHHR